MAVTKDRVAEQLKGLRELHGTPGKLLSTEKAASKAGVSSREWQRLEKKQIQNAHAGTLSKIADAYEIPLDSFDNGQPEKRSTPLAERLDDIDRKLDKIIEILEPAVTGPSEQEEHTEEGLPAPEPIPPARKPTAPAKPSPRKRQAKRRRSA